MSTTVVETELQEFVRHHQETAYRLVAESRVEDAARVLGYLNGVSQ